MNEANQIAAALAQIMGIASVTRGWPRQDARLPCAAVALSDQSAADTRDDAAYLTRHSYYIRVFAATMGACDALQEPVIGAMAALGYTLTRTLEVDGETAQQLMIFHKLI